jgi:capsular exopolysaccharide synthesis family protein
MSRIYDALKKAERLQASPPAAPRVDGRTAPAIAWELDEEVRLEYERIQVWITNRSPQNDPIQTVMVVSCQRGNGATTTAARLASTLAQWHTRHVLIVDANLRAPCLDLVFGTRNRAGLSELLGNGNGGGGEYVQPTRLSNLSVLTTGGTSRGALGNFSPAAIARLMARLKSDYDFVVFDAPALLEFPDAFALAPHVDAVLLVVEADRTLVDDARRVMRELEQAGTRTAGVILNRRRDYTPRLFRRLLYHANPARTAKR